MAERKPLSKKVRYEVLKRDSFTCQYCGRMSPDVILEVDHITPVAEGGTDDLINLITSCRDCNRGKGKIPLSDDSALKKQQASLKELAERREQMEMMMQWKSELADMKNEQIEYIVDYIISVTGDGVSSHGRRTLSQLISRFSFSEVLDATEISFDRYYNDDDESWEEAFRKIGGVCYNKRKQGGGENGTV